MLQNKRLGGKLYKRRQYISIDKKTNRFYYICLSEITFYDYSWVKHKHVFNDEKRVYFK